MNVVGSEVRKARHDIEKNGNRKKKKNEHADLPPILHEFCSLVILIFFLLV